MISFLVVVLVCVAVVYFVKWKGWNDGWEPLDVLVAIAVGAVLLALGIALFALLGIILLPLGLLGTLALIVLLGMRGGSRE